MKRDLNQPPIVVSTHSACTADGVRGRLNPMFRVVSFWFLVGLSLAVAHPNHQLELLSAQPGTDWEQEAYPIGNGWFGALVLAGVEEDQLRLSDKALRLNGELQSLGVLHVRTDHESENARALLRRLDLQSGLAEITYRHGNTRYRREYFCSYPDRILAARFRAQGQDALTLSFSLETDLPGVTTRYEPALQQIIVIGQLGPGEASFETRLQFSLKDGTAEWNGNQLEIRETSELTFLLSTSADEAFLPDEALATLDDESLSDIFQRHLADYQNLFHAMYLTIEGPSQTNWPTVQRLEAYRKDPRVDPGLEELYFQYARYLLIASSRKGTLPPHRRGIWFYPPTENVGNGKDLVGSDSMIYWPAKPTQLDECQPEAPTATDPNFGGFDRTDLPETASRSHRADQLAVLMNQWARQGEGDSAHRFLQSQIKERTLNNLMSVEHDVAANLGSANVINEMFLSSGRDLEFLPALPSAWPDGSVQGMRTEGGLEIAFAWQNGEFLEAYITALADQDCRISSGIPIEAELASGEEIAQRTEGGVLIVPMKAAQMIRVVRQED